MMRPPPCLTICRAAAWQHRKTPVRLTRSTRCHWASGCSRNGAECAIPALANITSRRPCSATTRSTKACTWAASPTSTPTAIARPPRWRISLTTALAASISTSPSATVAPSAAKSRAVARPIPSAPPVIAATRPCKRIALPSLTCGVSISGSCEPIGATRRAAEERLLLSGGRAGRDALERVPQRRPADPHLVHREVALERAAVRPEQLDARLDVWAPERGQLGRSRRLRLSSIVVRGQAHHHAAELHDHVLALRQLGDRRLPGREHLVTLARVGPVAERTAHVAHDDRRVREGSRQVHGVAKLRVECPGIERQAERSETGEARAEILLHHHVWPGGGPAVADHVARVPGRRVAHAAEAPAAGPDVRFQHRLDAIAEREIGEAHDAGRDARWPVEAAVAHRRLAGHELGLADRPHLLRARRAVHRVTFHEYRGDDIVAGADVGEKFVEQVAVVRALPQMMVGVDDGQVGIENGLGRLRRPPCLVRRVDSPELGRTRSHARALQPSFTPYFSSVSWRSSRPSPGASGTVMKPSTIFGCSRNNSNHRGSRVGSANDSRMKPVGLAATA